MLPSKAQKTESPLPRQVELQPKLHFPTLTLERKHRKITNKKKKKKGATWIDMIVRN